MLKSNLAVLLAERNLKITKVSKDTGISRTTLTALSYDANQGIQFDTLNNLCLYLGVTPAEFFCYAPFEVDVNVNRADSSKFNVRLSFINSQKKRLAEAVVIANTDYEKFAEGVTPFKGNLNVIIEPSTNPDDALILSRYLKPLSPVLQKEIELKVGVEVASYFVEKDIDEIQYKVIWEKMFF